MSPASSPSVRAESARSSRVSSSSALSRPSPPATRSASTTRSRSSCDARMSGISSDIGSRGAVPVQARFPILLSLRACGLPARGLPMIFLAWLRCPWITDRAAEPVEPVPLNHCPAAEAAQIARLCIPFPGWRGCPAGRRLIRPDLRSAPSVPAWQCREASHLAPAGFSGGQVNVTGWMSWPIPVVWPVIRQRSGRGWPPTGTCSCAGCCPRSGFALRVNWPPRSCARAAGRRRDRRARAGPGRERRWPTRRIARP